MVATPPVLSSQLDATMGIVTPPDILFLKMTLE
jgi:hypothetical protein